MDIKKFQEERGIGNTQAIEAIRAVFPKYSKAVHSMVSNAPMYGVALAPKAVKVLKAAYPTEQELQIKAALERMTAQPVKTDYDEDAQEAYTVCPVCGERVAYQQKCCAACGQRLGWEVSA